VLGLADTTRGVSGTVSRVVEEATRLAEGKDSAGAEEEDEEAGEAGEDDEDKDDGTGGAVATLGAEGTLMEKG
jgi:hypothetical protein